MSVPPEVEDANPSDLFAVRARDFGTYLAVERRCSPLTVATYGRDVSVLRDFATELGVDDPAMVALRLLRRFLAHLMQGGISSTTIARKIAALRSFFRFLVLRGFSSGNPAANLRLPRTTRPLPKFLSIDDAADVMEAPPSDGARGMRR